MVSHRVFTLTSTLIDKQTRSNCSENYDKQTNPTRCRAVL